MRYTIEFVKNILIDKLKVEEVKYLNQGNHYQKDIMKIKRKDYFSLNNVLFDENNDEFGNKVLIKYLKMTAI